MIVTVCSSLFTAGEVFARRRVLRGAAGGALGGAAVSSLAGGDAGKGAAWGAGIGAVRGLVREDRAREEERMRQMEQREAYERGKRDGARVDYQNKTDRAHADGMAY
jgi:hypothetical protein